MAPSRALRKICSEQSQRTVCLTSRASNKRPSCRRTIAISESSCRSFSTSIARKADELKPQSDGVKPPKIPRAIDLSTITSNPNYKAPEFPKRKTELNAETLDRLDSLMGKAKANTTTPSRPSRPPRPTAYNADTYASKGKTASTFMSPGLSNIMSFVDTKKNSAERTGYPVTSLTSDLSREVMPALRLGPSLGRSVRLLSGADLTRAFQTLEGRINGRGNAVRRDEKAQKFHVRAGQKKKIERRQRWRALFKQGYIAELNRVKKMIKQGW